MLYHNMTCKRPHGSFWHVGTLFHFSFAELRRNGATMVFFNVFWHFGMAGDIDVWGHVLQCPMVGCMERCRKARHWHSSCSPPSTGTLCLCIVDSENPCGTARVSGLGHRSEWKPLERPCWNYRLHLWFSGQSSHQLFFHRRNRNGKCHALLRFDGGCLLW